MEREVAMRALEPHAEAGTLGVVESRSFKMPLKEHSGKLPNRGSYPTTEDLYQAGFVSSNPNIHAVANAVLENGKPL